VSLAIRPKMIRAIMIGGFVASCFMIIAGNLIYQSWIEKRDLSKMRRFLSACWLALRAFFNPDVASENFHE